MAEINLDGTSRQSFDTRITTLENQSSQDHAEIVAGRNSYTSLLESIQNAGTKVYHEFQLAQMNQTTIEIGIVDYSYATDDVQLYINGIYLSLTQHYTLSTNVITLLHNYRLDLNDEIEIVMYQRSKAGV